MLYEVITIVNVKESTMPKSRTYTKDTKKSERQAYSGRYGWAKAINQTLFDTLKKNHIKILSYNFV